MLLGGQNLYYIRTVDGTGKTHSFYTTLTRVVREYSKPKEAIEESYVGGYVSGEVSVDNLGNGMGDAQSGGGWGTTANIINNVTNPALDMAIGGAEYNLGNVLTDRAKYSFTKAPWESAAIKGTTTIRTPLGNITAATKVLQTTGTVLKVAGATLGAIGMVGTYAQYKSGQIGGAEATADMIMGAVGFVPGWGWAVSGGYFLGKAIYQYATKP